MLVSHQERPRELKWYHAGPLLYGDLGTSRFYVLGLAFYFALNASPWYIASVGLLVMAVGWAYTVVCRTYPDGGGVYSAARQISPVLSVIGALLLFADYAVTAALSAFDGMHYFGLAGDHAVQIGACASILLLGIVNYIGPKRAGAFALVVAMGTLILTLVVVVFAVPHLGAGFSKIEPITHVPGGATHTWSTFVGVVLALSGIEAVANMTGIMVQPVERTARKSIWPVLAEVVVFNIVLGVAMLALPAVLSRASGHDPKEFSQPASVYKINDAAIEAYRSAHTDWDKPPGAAAYRQFADSYSPHSSPNEEDVKNKVVRVMAEQFVHPYFGIIAGFVFGLLLLSAVNTVIGEMVSVSYVMGRDQELPTIFTRLNFFGVPWAGLVPALLVPCILLMIFTDLSDLADLYAIGVVGAIAINLSSCTINRKLPIRTWERGAIGTIALIMVGIECTLAVEKPHALIFVALILGAGLGLRFMTKTFPALRARAARPLTPEELRQGLYRGVPITVPETARATPPARVPEWVGTPATELDMSKAHVMVATRGGPRLLEFAAKYTKRVDGILFVVYVRQFNLQFGGDATGPALADDAEARGVFQSAAEACAKTGVAMVPIYVVSADVPYSILDFAATYGVESLLMGVSRRGTLLRALQGDVITNVADNLPADIPLLIHA